MVPALRTPGWPIVPERVPVRRTSSDFFAANLHARLAGSSATVRTPNTGARPIRRSSTSRAPSTRERSPSARELHQRINAVRRPNVPRPLDGRLNHRRGSALAGLEKRSRHLEDRMRHCSAPPRLETLPQCGGPMRGKHVVYELSRGLAEAEGKCTGTRKLSGN